MHISCTIAGIKFAFPLYCVKSVISFRTPVVLPVAKKWVAGLLPYEGVSLPVIDPLKIPGFIVKRRKCSQNFIVIVEYGDYINGFLVSDVDVITDNCVTILDFDRQSVVSFKERFADGVLESDEAVYYLVNLNELHGSIDIA